MNRTCSRGNHDIPSNKSTGPTAARTMSTDEGKNENEAVENQHDIREYTKHIRKHKKDKVGIVVKSDGLKILRKLLHKL